MASDPNPGVHADRPPVDQEKLARSKVSPPQPAVELCDVCGSDQVVWRSCKLICSTCRTILKSCADL